MSPTVMSADGRSPFLRLPQEIRDIIYDYVLSVERSCSFYGVHRGIIFLADKPGYSRKLCNLAYFHNGYEWNDDYLTQDSEVFKHFISRTVDTWRLEINQLKYVCKQLRYETRGVALRINSGTKFVFHGTKTSEDAGVIGSMFNSTCSISGKASFIEFWTKCLPRWRMHVRDVDIIELPLKDEQPNHLGRHLDSINNRDTRTWLERLYALEFRQAFTGFFCVDILSIAESEKRSFRRRCAEMTGGGNASSKCLYSICQTNPSLRVIVRYNEWQESVDRDWIKYMCGYRMALRKGDVGIVMSKREKDLVHEHVLRNGGAALAPALDNLRMSSSVNMAVVSCHPRYYFLDLPAVHFAVMNVEQRKRDAELLFTEGV